MIKNVGYGYGHNNPTYYFDPSGLKPSGSDDNGDYLARGAVHSSHATHSARFPGDNGFNPRRMVEYDNAKQSFWEIDDIREDPDVTRKRKEQEDFWGLKSAKKQTTIRIPTSGGNKSPWGPSSRLTQRSTSGVRGRKLIYPSEIWSPHSPQLSVTLALQLAPGR